MKQGGIILPDSAVRKQTLNFKDSECLVILGKGDTRHDGAKIAAELDCECWGLNDIERFPEMTMLFDIHEKERAMEVSKDLADLKIPIMMQDVYPDIPMSVKFPMTKILEDFVVPYYNNQVCQMLAFAIHTRRFKKIYLFGVEYIAADRVEQEFERPCTEFWLGMAMGRGISLYIAKQSNLFTYTGYLKGIIYGYTPKYQEPFKGFREAQPHYWAEYLLGAYGGSAIGKEFYDHDEWMAELGKFCTRYVHDKLKLRKAAEDAKKEGEHEEVGG